MSSPLMSFSRIAWPGSAANRTTSYRNPARAVMSVSTHSSLGSRASAAAITNPNRPS